MSKRVSGNPCISTDGTLLSYVNTHYEYAGATRDLWGRSREDLMIANVAEETIRVGTIHRVPHRNTFGSGISSQSISGEGHMIAFYAGGEIERGEVENLEMPPYREVTHSDHASPTCDVFCYVVMIERPGRYRLRVVPDPDSPREPLIVAHPESGNVQSFNMSNVLIHPPSLTSDGGRIALHAGFVMGESKTGAYLYDWGTDATTLIRSFGSRPGTTDPHVPLVTASHPMLSGDGEWLTYFLREVYFPEHYSDPDMYEEGETYCPCTSKDEVVVRDLRSGEETKLIESTRDPAPPLVTPRMGLSIDRDGRHVTFISRTDKVEKNSDHSHEVFLATSVPELRRPSPSISRARRARLQPRRRTQTKSKKRR